MRGPRLAVVGRGRAGTAFSGALAQAGWRVEQVAGREVGSGDRAGVADRVEVVLLCVPDRAVAEVAASIEPGSAVVAHVSGSLGLDVLTPHARRASLHPLASLPEGGEQGDRLVGATFAVDGDPVATAIVDSLGGRAIALDPGRRVEYHAAATIASNHLVALLGQVERVSGGTGVPFDAYLDLVRQTVENVAALGPAAALTGPAARGDEDTLARHRAALDPAELAAYDALADLCRRLAAS